MPRARWLRRVAPTSLDRAAAWLVVLMAAIFMLLLGNPRYTNASKPPRWNADLAMQFARDAQDVGLIVGEAPSPDREVMRIKLYIDFAFIASYSSLFAVLGAMAARGPAAWHKIAGFAAAVCGPAAGLFDILENRAILAVLDTPLAQTTPAMLNAIRRAAAAKWTLAAVTVAVLAASFLISRKHESTT